MHIPLDTDRQKYYLLMCLVCESLPTTAIDTLVRNDHVATAAQLTAVRQGRKIELLWLIDLVKVGLPKFEIPTMLLPIPSAPSPVAAPLFDITQ